MTIFLLDGDKFLLINHSLVIWLGAEPKCPLYNFWVQNILGAAVVKKWSKDTFAHPSDPSDGLLVPDQSVELFGGNPNLSFKFLCHTFSQDECLKVIFSFMARIIHAVLAVIVCCHSIFKCKQCIRDLLFLL